MKLEDLKPDATVRGILPDGTATIVKVEWHGSDALTLVYRGPNGRVGQFGGWALRTHRGRQCVAYCRFIPNAMFRPGVVANAVLHEVSRALWVDERAFPGLPARNAWKIMASRDGLL